MQEYCISYLYPKKEMQIDTDRVKSIYQCGSSSMRNKLVKEFLSNYSNVELIILEDLNNSFFVDFKSILLKLKVLIEDVDSTYLHLFLNLILEGLRLKKKITVLEFSNARGLNVIIIPYKGTISINKSISSNKKIIYEK